MYIWLFVLPTGKLLAAYQLKVPWLSQCPVMESVCSDFEGCCVPAGFTCHLANYDKQIILHKESCSSFPGLHKMPLWTVFSVGTHHVCWVNILKLVKHTEYHQSSRPLCWSVEQLNFPSPSIPLTFVFQNTQGINPGPESVLAVPGIKPPVAGWKSHFFITHSKRLPIIEWAWNSFWIRCIRHYTAIYTHIARG